TSRSACRWSGPASPTAPPTTSPAAASPTPAAWSRPPASRHCLVEEKSTTDDTDNTDKKTPDFLSSVLSVSSVVDWRGNRHEDGPVSVAARSHGGQPGAAAAAAR